MRESSNLSKVAYFESLGIFPRLESVEYGYKLKLTDGGTYNPDYYDADGDRFIEVVTSGPNISEQRDKWIEAIQRICLRVFWWKGQEITEWVTSGKNYLDIDFKESAPGGRPRGKTSPAK